MCKKNIFNKVLTLAIMCVALSVSSLSFAMNSESKVSNNKMDIFQAIKRNDIERVRELVEDKAFDVNKPNRSGETPLSIACSRSCAEIVKLLLEYVRRELGELGAKEYINKVDKDGLTSLHYACMDGNAEIVKLLIELGADKNAVVVSQNGYNNGLTPLYIAYFEGHTEIVKLLLEHNVTIDQKTRETTFEKSEINEIIRSVLRYNAQPETNKLQFILNLQNDNANVERNNDNVGVDRNLGSNERVAQNNNFKLLIKRNFGQLIDNLNTKKFIFIDAIIRDSVFSKLFKAKTNLQNVFFRPNEYNLNGDKKIEKFVDDAVQENGFYLSERLFSETIRFFNNLLEKNRLKKYSDVKIEFLG